MNRDVAVAWDWEHDQAFVADLARRCGALGLSFRSVTPADVEGVLAGPPPRWGVLLDRAWESDARFRRLNDAVAAAGTRLVNAPELSLRMGNKATVGKLLRERGVAVPRFVDFMPADWSAGDLARAARDWKRPLWLKPASAGGGDGVLAQPDVPELFPHDGQWRNERFLLQEHAAPMDLGGRPAWFRVIHVFGSLHAFWWHPKTHVFSPLTAAEIAAYGLGCISATAGSVAAAAGLEIFSCEISLVAPDAPLVVDPVNDPVDFRRRSKAADAIPDDALAVMIDEVAKGLAGLARLDARLACERSPRDCAGEPPAVDDPAWRAECRRLFLERLPGRRILEVGCGPATDSARFLELGYDVLATDVAEEFVRIVRERYPLLPVQRMDLRAPALPPASFDGIYSMADFVHIARAEAPAALASLRRLLAPRGALFMSHLRSDRVREFVVDNGGGVPGNRTAFVCYEPEEMEGLLRAAGFAGVEAFRVPCPACDASPRLVERGATMWEVVAINA